MITVHFTSVQPDGTSQIQTVQTSHGQSLMDAANAAGIAGIAADCGGLLTCATCHVFTSENWAALLPAPSADEKSMLHFTAVPHKPNSRLSCQIQMTPELDGLMVELPSTQY